jgi:hypothetical protein
MNPDLPAELYYFIKKATQKDPAKRYQSMSQVLVDLRRLADRQLVGRAAGGNADSGRMVLVMSCENVDQMELAPLVEDFSERLKTLGVELSVVNAEPS